MPSPQRRCSTCRHFQPAPLWRKGWCRNPALYAAYQNHLVDERDLDCHRGFDDYWQPLDDAAAAPPTDQPAQAAVAEPTSAAPAAPSFEAVRTQPAATGQATMPRRTPEPVAPPRAAADYIRLAVPAIIVLVLLGAYVLWTGLLFRSAATPPATATISPTLPVVIFASPTAAPTPSSPTPAAPSPTTPPAAATSAPAVAPTATQPPAGLRAGGAATVETGPDNANLRLRRDPSLTSPVVKTIKNGERLAVTEGPREADGQTWWKVEHAGDAGWVSASFIKPAT